jgi:L-iditol 2-dehydrogenase
LKAIVKEGPGPGFALREVPKPQSVAGTVIVQVKAVGICGTDIPIFDGVRPVPYPLIPGHEFAGVVTELGPDVEGWHVGDRVSIDLVKGCAHCRFCRIGDESLCDELTEIGIDVNGAYAEYVAVPVSCLHHLPQEMPFEVGASVDPLASAYRGVRKVAVSSEDIVVIFGSGPIGLYALQSSIARGARMTIVVDKIRGRRLEVANLLGADHVFCSAEEDPGTAIARCTDGQMASVVIEATGSAQVLPAVIDAAAKGARIALLGIFHQPATFEVRQIVRRELQIMGSFCYSWDDFEESLRLLADGKVATERMITHVLPLEKMEQALALMRSGEAIKVILKP